MKTIELSTGTLLVVDGQDEFTLTYDPVIDYSLLDFKDSFSPLRGQWLLLGHPSEITGEVWGKVVDSKKHPILSRMCYKNYDTVYACWVNNPKESGLSLIAAHNIKDTDVLLFRPKNKQP